MFKVLGLSYKVSLLNELTTNNEEVNLTIFEGKNVKNGSE